MPGLLRKVVIALPAYLALSSAPLMAQVWVETVRTIPTIDLYPTSFVETVVARPAPVLYGTSFSRPLRTWDLTETAYVVPTSTTRTTTLLPTTTVVPTTTYLPTSTYLVPTSTTVLRPRGIFRRPVVATNYYSYAAVPTVYISPSLVETSYALPVSATVGLCCETVASMVPANAPTASPQAERAPSSAVMQGSEPALSPTSGQAPAAKAPSKMKPSQQRTTANPPTIESTPAASAAKPGPTSGLGAVEDEKSPPSLPAEPAKGAEKDPVPPPASSFTKPSDGPAPLPGADLPSIPESPTPDTAGSYFRRESRKPVLSNASQGKPISSRTLLEGIVISEASSQPLQGVTVTLTDRLGRFQRTAVSDANGEYRVSLPDGDWRVEVASKSGRMYEVSKLTVADGLITDATDRPVGGLLITR